MTRCNCTPINLANEQIWYSVFMKCFLPFRPIYFVNMKIVPTYATEQHPYRIARVKKKSDIHVNNEVSNGHYQGLFMTTWLRALSSYLCNDIVAVPSFSLYMYIYLPTDLALYSLLYSRLRWLMGKKRIQWYKYNTRVFLNTYNTV